MRSEILGLGQRSPSLDGTTPPLGMIVVEQPETVVDSIRDVITQATVLKKRLQE